MTPTNQDDGEIFAREWRRFHGDDAPVGHRLTSYAGWNLTRFNFLPANANSAGTHDALRAMLRRYDEVARRVLGDGEPCYIVMLRTPNENDLHKGRMDRLTRRHGVRFAMSFHEPESKLTYAAFAARTTWRPGQYVRETLMFYQRRIWDVIWMNSTTGAVFRPFDAGADVSAQTPRDLMDLIQEYSGWLPTKGLGFVHLDPAHVNDQPLTVSKGCAAAITRAVTKEGAE